MEDAEKRSQETYHFSRMRVESVCVRVRVLQFMQHLHQFHSIPSK